MGYASQVIIFYGSISYIVILAWAFLYFFSSLSGELPWATCNNTWNTGELVICLQALSVLAHAPLTITAFVWSVYTFSFSIYNHLQKTVCKKWNIMCDNWNLPKLISSSSSTNHWACIYSFDCVQLYFDMFQILVLFWTSITLLLTGPRLWMHHRLY